MTLRSTPAAPYESLSTALDPEGRAIHTRTPNAPTPLRDMMEGLVGEAARGLTAPGRALRGEPVTYGDAWATALDYGAMSAPTSAPEGALRAGGMGDTKGIRAYHGSPHDFDRFDMSKIGTGEGAQAYGHGLYFAESEDVAKMYRDELSNPDNFPLRIKDEALNTVWTDELRERFPAMYNGLGDEDALAMDGILGTLQGVTTQAQAKDVIKYSMPQEWQRLAWRRVYPELRQPTIGPGSMYEVNINADPADFLDWDAPLPEGSPVRGLLDEAAQRDPGLKGHSAIAKIDANAPDIMTSADWTSERLREAGIPGIKYKDGFSRGAEGGTRNFVVFDDELVSIVRKYGIAGAATYLGMPEDEIRTRMGDM